MTPNDIATDISGLKPGGDGCIATSMNYTYCYVPTANQGGFPMARRMDDADSCD